MKLGELRAAIRKTKETPFVNIYPFPGTNKGFRFALQKTPLLAELEVVYPGGKAVETHLEFDVATGKLFCPTYESYMGTTREETAMALADSTVQPGGTPDDEDDLDLGDVPVMNVSPVASSNDLDDLLG